MGKRNGQQGNIYTVMADKFSRKTGAANSNIKGKKKKKETVKQNKTKTKLVR